MCIQIHSVGWSCIELLCCVWHRPGLILSDPHFVAYMKQSLFCISRFCCATYNPINVCLFRSIRLNDLCFLLFGKSISNIFLSYSYPPLLKVHCVILLTWLIATYLRNVYTVSLHIKLGKESFSSTKLCSILRSLFHCFNAFIDLLWSLFVWIGF